MCNRLHNSNNISDFQKKRLFFKTPSLYQEGVTPIVIGEEYVPSSGTIYEKKGKLTLFDEDYDYKNIRIGLLNVDEHYYRYHTTLRLYSGDDPFSEPAPIYSNIVGGLGVFGAYNKTTVVKDFN
jgi:hypothetical protein